MAASKCRQATAILGPPERMHTMALSQRSACVVRAELGVHHQETFIRAKNMTCGMMTSEMNDLDIVWSFRSALM